MEHRSQAVGQDEPRQGPRALSRGVELTTPVRRVETERMSQDLVVTHSQLQSPAVFHIIMAPPAMPSDICCMRRPADYDQVAFITRRVIRLYSARRTCPEPSAAEPAVVCRRELELLRAPHAPSPVRLVWRGWLAAGGQNPGWTSELPVRKPCATSKLERWRRKASGAATASRLRRARANASTVHLTDRPKLSK